MATTTFALIRAGFETQMESITPTLRGDVTYTKALDEQPFEEWVAANPQACFRQFSIRNPLNWERVEVTGTDLLETVQGCLVSVGYPPGLGEYGAENLRDVDDLIESDMDQIDEAIGIHGYPNYVSGLHSSELLSAEVTEHDSGRVLTMTFALQYYRDRS